MSEVLSEYEFEYRKNIETKRVSLKYRAVAFPMQGKEALIFQSKTYLRLKYINLEIDVGILCSRF